MKKTTNTAIIISSVLAIALSGCGGSTGSGEIKPISSSSYFKQDSSNKVEIHLVIDRGEQSKDVENIAIKGLTVVSDKCTITNISSNEIPLDNRITEADIEVTYSRDCYDPDLLVKGIKIVEFTDDYSEKENFSLLVKDISPVDSKVVNFSIPDRYTIDDLKEKSIQIETDSSEVTINSVKIYSSDPSLLDISYDGDRSIKLKRKSLNSKTVKLQVVINYNDITRPYLKKTATLDTIIYMPSIDIIDLFSVDIEPSSVTIKPDQSATISIINRIKNSSLSIDQVLYKVEDPEKFLIVERDKTAASIVKPYSDQDIISIKAAKERGDSRLIVVYYITDSQGEKYKLEKSITLKKDLTEIDRSRNIYVEFSNRSIHPGTNILDYTIRYSNSDIDIDPSKIEEIEFYSSDPDIFIESNGRKKSVKKIYTVNDLKDSVKLILTDNKRKKVTLFYSIKLKDRTVIKQGIILNVENSDLYITDNNTKSRVIAIYKSHTENNAGLYSQFFNIHVEGITPYSKIRYQFIIPKTDLDYNILNEDLVYYQPTSKLLYSGQVANALLHRGSLFLNPEYLTTLTNTAVTENQDFVTILPNRSRSSYSLTGYWDISQRIDTNLKLSGLDSNYLTYPENVSWVIGSPSFYDSDDGSRYTINYEGRGELDQYNTIEIKADYPVELAGHDVILAISIPDPESPTGRIGESMKFTLTAEIEDNHFTCNRSRCNKKLVAKDRYTDTRIKYSHVLVDCQGDNVNSIEFPEKDNHGNLRTDRNGEIDLVIKSTPITEEKKDGNKTVTITRYSADVTCKVKLIDEFMF